MGTSEFPMTADPSTRVIQLEMASANYVPIPADRFHEMTARYPTLSVPFDVLER